MVKIENVIDQYIGCRVTNGHLAGTLEGTTMNGGCLYALWKPDGANGSYASLPYVLKLIITKQQDKHDLIESGYAIDSEILNLKQPAP